MQYLHLCHLKNVKMLCWLQNHRTDNMKPVGKLLMAGIYLD